MFLGNYTDQLRLYMVYVVFLLCPLHCTGHLCISLFISDGILCNMAMDSVFRFSCNQSLVYHGQNLAPVNKMISIGGPFPLRGPPYPLLV